MIKDFIINILFNCLLFLIKDKYTLLYKSEDFVYGRGYTQYFKEKFSQLNTDTETTIDKYLDTPNGIKFRVCKIKIKTIKND
ncbi:MAG: hypothetical protein WCT77_08605 [Bacteroidota bacterium]|jgi:hypothetical protein